MGTDELLPREAAGSQLYGSHTISLTAFGCLDTLLIAALPEEYEITRDHLLQNMDFGTWNVTLPLFTAVSDLLGGLLGAHALSGDNELLQKAKELGEIVLGSFVGSLPKTTIQFGTNSTVKGLPYHMPVAYFGGLSLDLLYLADVTDDARYQKIAHGLGEYLRSLQTQTPGVFGEEVELQLEYVQPNYVPYGIGHKVGPAYEYLIKESRYVDGRDKRAKAIAQETAKTLHDTFIDHFNGRHTFARHFRGVLSEESDQSSCFALGAISLGLDLKADSLEFKQCYYKIKQVAEHCLEQFRQSSQLKDTDASRVFSHNRLPESLFLLWHSTRDVDYRKMGLEMANIIEEKWRSDGGYIVPGTDFQPNYLLRDTLKYLYLLFAPSAVLSPADYVFNTAGHPYPINKMRPVMFTELEVVIPPVVEGPIKRKVRILQASLKAIKLLYTART
jgi:mannosyl-oligosaccharide alpha-1,2-mannosidase